MKFKIVSQRMHFANAFVYKLYLIHGILNSGNQLRVLGGPCEAVGGTAGPDFTHSSLVPDCRNPRGRPGWGTILKPTTQCSCPNNWERYGGVYFVFLRQEGFRQPPRKHFVIHGKIMQNRIHGKSNPWVPKWRSMYMARQRFYGLSYSKLNNRR